MSEKKITEISELEYTSPETDYVWKYANEYIPDEFTTEEGKILLGESQVPYKFVDRYNKKRLKANFSYQKYAENRALQLSLKSLGLDSNQFWYLFLFIYDLTWGYYMDGCIVDNTVLEQLKDFIDTLEKQTTEKPKEEITLIAQTDQKIATLKSFNAIQHIISYCKQGVEKEEHCFPDFLKYQTSNTQLAYGIAQELFLFFDLMESVKQQRRKGAKMSKAEKELIVEILKFANCVESPITSTKNYMNALMDKSKRRSRPSLNNYYF